MPRLRAGDEVIHPQWGYGTVLGLRPGHHVRVRFVEQPGLPRTVTEPRSAPRMPANDLSSVVLPQPFLPITPTTSPG